MTYGREWKAGLLCGLVAGIVAGWIWTTIGGWFIAAENKNWWDIATAIGTLLAVAAAISVPMVQTAYANQRELRRSLPHRFSAARSARGANEALNGTLTKWRDKDVLKLQYCQAMRDRLVAISSRIPDANGMEIYLRLITMTQALIAHAGKREERRKEIEQEFGDKKAAAMVPLLDDEARESIAGMLGECLKLIAEIDLWEHDIRDDYHRAKLKYPVIPPSPSVSNTTPAPSA